MLFVTSVPASQQSVTGFKIPPEYEWQGRFTVPFGTQPVHPHPLVTQVSPVGHDRYVEQGVGSVPAVHPGPSVLDAGLPCGTQHTAPAIPAAIGTATTSGLTATETRD